MEKEKKLRLLQLRYNILYAINYVFKYDFRDALILLNQSTTLLEALIKEATKKEEMFYEIIKIGLNNAKNCIHKKLRTTTVIELCHICDIPLLFMIDEYQKQQEDFYWNVTKATYETHSKKELTNCFKEVWDALMQQKD